MSSWKILEEESLYFVTSTIVEWQHIFTSDEAFEILLDALRYSTSHRGLHLHGYVLMTNHCHFIISAHPSKHLSNIMRDFKRFTSRRISSMLREQRRYSILDVFQRGARKDHRGNDFKVWRDGFHPIALFSSDLFNQKLEYIHDNPVKKGFVERPEDWKYSSARNYFLGDHSLIRVECLK